jgi:hypothetical protein
VPGLFETVRLVQQSLHLRIPGKRMSQIPNATRLFGLQDHYSSNCWSG